MQSTIGLLKSKYCKQDVVPENGLAIFCGMVLGKQQKQSNNRQFIGKNVNSANKKEEESLEEEEEEEEQLSSEEEIESNNSSTTMKKSGKEKLKKVIIDIVPLVPLKHSLYFCDNRFHVELLLEGLQDCIINDNETSSIGVGKAKKLGFIIITGDSCCFATLTGNSSPQIVHEMKVSLPKKHGKGGQSALRFERIRTEARHNYLTKVAEKASQFFLSCNHQNVLVDAIILGGYASLKDAFFKEELMDYRLRSKIAAVVDTQYGGNAGLREAIEKCGSNVMEGIRYSEETRLINSFMSSLIQNENSIVYGIHLTMHALEAQIIKTLLICEDCLWKRCILANGKIIYSKEANIPCLESISIVQYCIEQHKKFGVDKLHLLGMKNNETIQFQNGFDGIAGFLHYNVDFSLENVNFSQDEIQTNIAVEEEDLSDFI